MSTPELADAVDRLAAARAAGVRVVDEPAAKSLVAALGLATPRGRVVGSADAVVQAAASVGLPVAVKLADSELPHKSDIGGVAGPLRSLADVREAAQRLTALRRCDFLVEAWMEDGIACFAGLSLQGPFGPMLSFGLGGVWVEVLRDVVHRLAPLSLDEIHEMVLAPRGATLLRGARGRPAVGLEELCSSLSQLSRLALDDRVLAVVETLDINPLLVRSDGPPVALDATAVLRTPTDRPADLVTNT